MLRIVTNTAIFGTYLIVIGFLGFVLWQSLFSSKKIDQGESDENAANTEQQYISKQASRGRTSPSSSETVNDAIVTYTKWLAIFTALLVLATVALFASGERNVDIAEKAANAAKKSAEIAKQALFATQRAVIGTDGFGAGVMYRNDGIVNGYVIEIKWENSGSTAALNVSAGITYELINSLDVDSVTFDDLPIRQRDNITLAQRRNFTSARSITIEEIMRVYRKEARLFVLGRTEYDDVFKQPHHTQICAELQMFSDPSVPVVGDPEKRPRILRFAVWHEHNSSD